ncbi:MAG: metal-dependent hydrolase [Methanobacteriaceae archaeon]|nr:metal-dependent hydrolase [Candidatus Methanorudis spinitermitis]
MQIKWFGHAAFEIISDEGVKILIDPFISNNPSCTTPVEEIEADFILISHGHTDHFGDSMEIANRTGATLVGNHEISLFLSKQGFDTIGMNIGGSIQIQNIKVTMLDAKHSAGIDFTEELISGGSASSFLLTLESGKKIFHSGDTGLFGDMETVIGNIYKPDIALLPIGDKFTMGPFEGAIATKWISPKKVIPMHYNTFPIIEQNTAIFSNFIAQMTPNIEVIILNPGEVYSEK